MITTRPAKMRRSDVLSLIRVHDMRDNSVPHVVMHGTDRGDHYTILDMRDTAPATHRYVFLFHFGDDDDAVPFERFEFDTMIEAVLHMSYRFVLDNCDGADSDVPAVKAKHNALQKILCAMTSFK